MTDLPLATEAAEPSALSRRRVLQAAALTSVAVGAGAASSGAVEARAAVPKAVYSTFSPRLPLRTTPEWHLARRAAHAPTPALAAKIKALGPAAWVDRQLKPSAIPDPVVDTYLREHLSWVDLSPAAFREVSGDRLWLGAPLLQRATLLRQVFSERVLFESVVEVMGDQVHVSATGKADGWVLDYDRSVVRRHALGKFSTFLAAALRHPGLLVYIDNDVNTADSPNENLGRELLELHTVGEGHYTEADVRQSALLLTGHSMSWSTAAYEYRPRDHHVGPLTVMGFHHPNATAEGGPQVLTAYATYLARHPATAQRIARRLAVRFVADAPSKALVDALAAVYLASGTSIAAVLRALFASAQFQRSVGKKWRRPQEWMATMVRAGRPTWKPTGRQDDPWDMLGYHSWLMEQAHHVPRAWPVVNGYPDSADYWMGTGTTLAHWNTAEVWAGRWNDELVARPWAGTLGIKAGLDVWTVAAKVTLTLTGYTWRKEDLTVVASLLSSSGRSVPPAGYRLTADNVRWDVTEAVRVVLASPYFMIR